MERAEQLKKGTFQFGEMLFQRPRKNSVASRKPRRSLLDLHNHKNI